MKETTISTIRLKKQEAADLADLSFMLTKKNVMAGLKKMHSESEIVHFIIKQTLKRVDVDETGNLKIIEDRDIKKR